MTCKSWVSSLNKGNKVAHIFGYDVAQVELEKIFFGGKYSKIAIVTDTNVDRIYRKSWEDFLLMKQMPFEIFVVAAGEKSKTLLQLEALAEKLLQLGFDRQTLVVALGGGVVGDLAGFLAATFMRGIGLVQVPTSLLAMVDASIGGKTGVDLKSGKNLLGAFYPPLAVLTDLRFLQTLPEVELRSGMAELIKHGLIGDKALLAKIANNAEALMRTDLAIWSEILLHGMQIKIEIVEKDPLELHERKYLNLGHTVGHSLEQATEYKLAHGFAVAWGIAIEALMAKNMTLLAETEFEEILQILRRFGLFVELPRVVTVERLWEIMAVDKKNESGKVVCALPAILGTQIEIMPVTKEEFTKAWEEFNALIAC